MKIFLIFFVTVFIFSGCSSKKRVVAPVKTLPSWYTNQTQSDKNTLYSVGEGEDKAQALSNALNNMASTLSVSIESDLHTKSVVRNGTISSIQRDTTNKVHSRVEKIRISDYQIINTKEFGFQRYIVQIKSNKYKLFSSLDKELSQKFSIIQIKHEESQKYNTLKRLSIYKEAKDTLMDIENTLIVMHSLNSSFDDSSYLSKALEVESRYDTLLAKITFSIESNYDAKNLIASVRNGLSLEKYKIVKPRRGDNHFKIHIISSTKKAKSYGFDLARSAISLTVKNNDATVIGSNKFNLTGQSTQGYAIAKENVAVKLNTKIIQSGIEKILGLEL
ncbi:LPP20 family lipoprotein [Sulfurimonas sp.]|nr:LPP20 family lipoprotein [Sulfurimonas sp.]